jgi:hypothetical protein
MNETIAADFASSMRNGVKNACLTPFSADWTITKDGEKALIYPLVAIEDCSVDYSDEGQDHCRKKCYSLFYSEDLF